MRGGAAAVVLLFVSYVSQAVTTETWSWVSECQAYHAAFSGNSGVVLHFGDSISYANQYTAWMRGRAGATAEDNAILDWMHSLGRAPGAGPTDDTSDFTTILANWQQDGTWLAYIDRAGYGSYTTQSGIRADQYRNGTYNLPTPEAMLDAYQPEVVILMLGTNDIGAGRATADIKADLENIIQHIIWQDGDMSGSYRGTIPIISTIPPRRNYLAEVQALNTEIINLAQQYHLPLIDFYGEIMDRQPTNWDGTLINGSDGVHPSPSWGSYDSYSDPYQNNGEPLDYVGYLLRGWLSVQKLKEVKAQVIDGTPGTLTITTSSLPDGYVGAAYSNSLQATGGTPPYSWTQTGGTMAPGLTLNSDGTITGTPTTTGDYTFTAQVTDQASSTDSKSISISILSGTPTTVTLDVVQDAYIDSANPDNNNGAATNIAMGGNNGTPGWVRITLLKFSLPADLSGAAVQSAVLKLYANSDARGGEVVVSQLLQDWVEGTGDGTASGDGATWNTYDGVNAWPGGDFLTGANWSDIVLGSEGNRPVTTYTDGSYTFSCVINGSPAVGSDVDPGYDPAVDDWDGEFLQFDVTEAVQNWADGNPNYGLAMMMNGKVTRDGGNTYTNYGYGNVNWLSKEFSTSGYSPVLTITYIPGGGGGGDTTPPTVTCSSFSIQGTVSDAGTGVASVVLDGTTSLTVTGGQWGTADLTISGGSGSAQVVAEDLNGNQTTVNVSVSVN